MCKPCVGAKLVLRFHALIAHAFLDRSIPFVVPQIGMYIRINVSKTDFIYLRIWCDSFTFCQRELFFYSPCISIFEQFLLDMTYDTYNGTERHRKQNAHGERSQQ